MDNYPLHQNKFNPNALEPTSCYITEEYIEKQYKLYLTTHYTRSEDGNVHRTYRLHAVDPHSIEMSLVYDIKCPKCRTHLLKQVGRCLNYHDLGLYKCPVCNKD